MVTTSTVYVQAGLPAVGKGLEAQLELQDFTSTSQMIHACVTRQILSPCGWGVHMRLCRRVACTFVFCFWQVCGTVCTSNFGPQDHLSISISKQKSLTWGVADIHHRSSYTDSIWTNTFYYINDASFQERINEPESVQRFTADVVMSHSTGPRTTALQSV